jgi:hypothetical protein
MADDKSGPVDRTQITPQSTSLRTPSSTESGTLFRPNTGTSNTSNTNSSAPSASDWQVTSPSKWATDDKTVLGVGSVLKDRFILERVVGRGGMGTVFCARDRRKEEAQDRFPYVAVKILNEDFKKHPESLKLLQREARKAQQLAHPNIVTVFDFDRDGSNVFIVMELLQGQSLDRIIKSTGGSGMSVNDAVRIAASLGQALAYAHKKNVIHLDFKPANAYVDEEGGVKILDFGIAQAMKRDDVPEVEQTQFRVDELGALTPSYASLEMLEGEDPDPRDDLYALACVTYELLTGRHPFGRQPAKFALEYKLKLVRPKGLSSRRWQALKNALAFKREDRTRSVDEFIAELTNEQRSPLWGWSVAATGFVAVIGATYWYAQSRQQDADRIAMPAATSLTSDRPAATNTGVQVAIPTEPSTPIVTDDQIAARQALIDRRKDWLLQMTKANDVATALDVLLELRADLPADDIFLQQTAPEAIAAANLRLADRALQRANYSVASEYVLAAQQHGATLPGLQQRKDAINNTTQLDNSLRAANNLSASFIRNRLSGIRSLVPNSYNAIENNLAGTFAERINKERRTNSPTASELLAVATQVFGHVPSIAALNRATVQPASVTPNPHETQTVAPPSPAIAQHEPQVIAAQPVTPEPVPDPPKQEPKPVKKKPDVIITF